MRYRKLDANGDYTFGSAAQNFYYDLDAVAQAIKTRLKLLSGEWWEDIQDGLPLFNIILKQKGTPQGIKTIETLIGERILDTIGVTSISSAKGTFDPTKRSYSYSAQVNTIYGTVTIQEVLM